MTTYKELQAQIQELRQQANAVRLVEKVAVLDTIRALIIEHELQPRDFGFSESAKRLRTTAAAAKYSDPTTGKTWSGRGRTPMWLDGVDRARFEI